MDPNFQDLSAWNLNNPQQPNVGYPSIPSGGYPGTNTGGYAGYPDSSSGSFTNSNTIGYSQVPAPNIFPGQTTDTYFNNTPCSAPGGFPEQRWNNPNDPFSNNPGYPNTSYPNTTPSVPYTPGAPTFKMDYESGMQKQYIAGNPSFHNPQSNFSLPPSTSGGCSMFGDSVNTNRESVYPMFNDIPVPVTYQSNDFPGTSRGFGFAESAPQEDIMEPTLKAAPNFCVERDCEHLKKAMAGIGSNKKEIIAVMGHRSVNQRVEIVKKYKSMYGKDLLVKFKEELHNHLEDCLIALCYSSVEFDATELRKAMSGAGTDEDVLIEILCSRTNEQIRRIKDLYPKIYNGRDLEKDVKKETSRHFQRICIALLQANRDESTSVDTNLVRRDVEDLYKAGESKIGTDESKFIHILVSRSYSHLRAVFDEYTSHGKRNMADALKSEMHGHTLDALLSIVRCIQSKPRYFAAKLLKAIKAPGTDDKTLIRIIVSRCEVDMGQIKREFLSLNGKTLETCIHDKTSGEYRQLLLALIGA
ncbi:Annexin A7 isoform 1 [Schistosoma japonicum]|uniref:Annexin n=1 Tax=Schistosoma japonicum TaxID=6182 RepID=A0A4Z2CQH0_SCHJA|nr:Annexin A7 isoform 1 [Schistosoma japonicum]